LHDRPHHLAQRWITYRRRSAVGDLFLGPYPTLIAALTSKRTSQGLRSWGRKRAADVLLIEPQLSTSPPRPSSAMGGGKILPGSVSFSPGMSAGGVTATTCAPTTQWGSQWLPKRAM